VPPRALAIRHAMPAKTVTIVNIVIPAAPAAFVSLPKKLRSPQKQKMVRRKNRKLSRRLLLRNVKPQLKKAPAASALPEVMAIAGSTPEIKTNN
jgi:hypothetical protein